MFFYIDPVYFAFAIPGFILAGIASIYTYATFSKYSGIPSSKGITGAEAAARLLRSAGITDVKIEQVDGFLSDHYDPTSRTLRLSPKVYGDSSLSSIGVACHEAGHALQHAAMYFPMHIRSMLVPATTFSSFFSYIVLTAGLFLQSPKLIMIGVAIFSVAVLFSIVTLPVEWDASARAKKLMVSCGIVSQAESEGAGSVLNAAFMTYLASAVSSLLMLAYYIFLASRMNDRD